MDGVLAGFTMFRADTRGRLIFPHTEVDPAFRGRGIAQQLVAGAMADVASRGETVIPHCPVVSAYLRKNDVPGLDVDLADAPAPGVTLAAMTRLDTDDAVATEASSECDGPRALLLESREVPLGGVRAMAVRRALPQRDLPLVGAWCFLDRFGPQVTRMRVEPHPHIGLQTVTWPFVGEVRHRDTIGSDVVVRRGALNLMTSGAGIAHSEYSVGEDAVPLDALQLWVALPECRRHGAPAFERHEDLPVVPLDGRLGCGRRGDRGARRVRRRRLARRPSTRRSSAPSCASRRAPACACRSTRRGSTRSSAVEGDVTVMTATESAVAARRRAPALPRRAAATTSRSRATTGATLFLLGGEPFEDDIVMWWNFVGRSHEEIVQAREDWEGRVRSLRPRRRSRRRADPRAAAARRAPHPSAPAASDRPTR